MKLKVIENIAEMRESIFTVLYIYIYTVRILYQHLCIQCLYIYTYKAAAPEFHLQNYM